MRRSQALYEHRHPPPLTGAINSCLYAWLPSSTTAAPNLHVSVAIHSHGKVVHLSRAVPHSNRRLVARPHPCIVMRAWTLTYMHTCIRTHIQAYIHAYMHACTHTPAALHRCMHSVCINPGRQVPHATEVPQYRLTVAADKTARYLLPPCTPCATPCSHPTTAARSSLPSLRPPPRPSGGLTTHLQNGCLGCTVADAGFAGFRV